MSFWTELKRRKVFTTAAAYAVIAWVLVQIADIVIPAFDLPNWIFRALLILVAAGFLVTVVLAWAYELRSDGIKRTGTAPDDVTRAASPTRRRLEVLVIGLAFAALGLLVLNNYGGSPAEGRPGAIAPNSLAVLAFANRSDDPADAYFADGLADELLSVLGRVKELRVASRTASFYYKGKDIEAAEIASTLRVANVLSGGVQRDGDRIRVTVTLDQTRDGVVLWSNSYDERVESLLDIQSDIAHAVASAIVPVLSPESRAQIDTQPTESPEAYDYYLRGNDYLRMPGEVATLSSARELFDRAIDLDPRFAQAYAARCNALLETYQLTRAAEAFESAEVACHRALTLDNDAWEVRLALGNLYRMSGQYDKALDEYAAALAQQPNHAGLHVAMGWVHAAENRPDAAEASFLRAAALESGYWLVHNELAWFYSESGRYDEAIDRYRRVIELTPDSGIGYDNLGNTYLSMGRLNDAERAFDESPEPSRWTFENRGLVRYFLGEFDEAIEDQKRAIALAPGNYRTWGNLGDAYRLAGDQPSARDAYTRAVELADEELAINPDDFNTIARLGLYLAYLGDVERSGQLAEKVVGLDAATAAAYSVDYYVARTRLQLGELESAYIYFGKAIDGGWSRALVLSDPDLVAQAGDERHERL